MPAEWLLIATPLGAAVASVAGTYAATRPRRVITIDRVAIEPSRSEGLAPVPIDNELVAKVAAFPEAIRRLTGTTAPERTYITWLRLVQVSLEVSTRNLDYYLERVSTLRDRAAARDLVQVYSIWRNEQTALWLWAEGAAARGRDVFSTEDPDASRGELDVEARPWDEDEERALYLVDFSDFNAIFQWGNERSRPAQTRSRSVARRASRAFTCDRVEDLVQLFTAIREEIARTRDQGDALSSACRAELAKYDRLRVEFVISNPGRSALSISPTAHVIVSTKGYAYSAQRNNTQVAGQDASFTLRLQRADAIDRSEAAARNATTEDIRVEASEPILLLGGEALRVIGTSEELISQHELGPQLQDLYRAGERTLQLLLGRFKQPSLRRSNKNSIGLIKSRKVLFRDLRLLD